MFNSNALGRLLWKEMREDWLVLVAAAIIPAITLPLASLSITPYIEQTIFRYIGMLTSPLLIVVWASRKGGVKREEGKSALAHLPTSRTAQWLVPIAAPWLLSTAIGVWYGFICSATHIGTVVEGSTAISGGQLSLGSMCMLGAYILSTAFAGCYLLSAAASPWAGLLCGAIWALGAPDWMAMGLWNASVRQNTLLFIARTSYGAVGCLAFFITLSFARRVRFTASRAVARLVRAVPIVLLIGVMFGPIAHNLLIFRHRLKVPADFGVLMSTDRSLMAYGKYEPSDRKVHVTLADQRTGRRFERGFEGSAIPITFEGRNRLFFARQLIGEYRVRIYAWDTASDQIQLVTVISAPEISRFTVPQCTNQVSPDGRYLAAILPSWAGRGVDVWIVDMVKHEQWIAFPNEYSRIRQLSWFDHRMAISGLGGIQTIDLDTKQTEYLNDQAIYED